MCAFLRGGEVLVAVAVRGDLATFQPPSGTWDDVYRTPTCSWPSAKTVCSGLCRPRAENLRVIRA